MNDAPGRPPRLVLGLALLVPALLAWLYSYVLPTVSTVSGSLHGGPEGEDRDWVGFDNYDALGDAGFGQALWLTVIPLFVVWVIAPTLAWAATRAGTTARLVTLGGLALPMAAFAPIGLAVGWFVSRWERPDELTRDLDTLSTVLWLTTFGFVCGVAVTCYLVAMRRRSINAGLAMAALLTIVTVAAALQVYGYPQVVNASVYGDEPLSPTAAAAEYVTYRYEFGPAQAIGTLQLLLLALLGLAATLLVTRARLRLEFAGWRRTRADLQDPAPGFPRGEGWGTTLVLLAGVLALTLYGIWPWLRPTLGLTVGELPEGRSAAQIVAHGWLPPLVGTIVAVGIALLGGFAIGGLRPLGERSELLLLPFAPWLFVGVGPMMVSLFERTRDLEQIDTWAGLVPPGWVSIPALYVFTLLFRGLGAGWRERGTGLGRDVLLPALPMVALLGGLVWVLRAQDLLWPNLVAPRFDQYPAAALVILQHDSYTPTGQISLGLLTPLPLLIALALGLLALQLTYVERLTLVSDTKEPEPGPGWF